MALITKIPHSGSAGRTLMLFIQTARLIHKYVDAYFYRKTSVSFTKFMVLKLINSTNDVMNQTQIAEWTQTEQHNIGPLIERLKKDGLVYTKRSYSDKRKVNVFLTDKGQVLLNQALPIAEEIIDNIMSSINEADNENLSNTLEVLRNRTYEGLESITKG